MSLRISGGRRLQSPKGDVARPTSSRVRLAVMNLLADRIRGSRWLDLCCGSGAMACEALQRGAALVVAIERDPRVAAVARANLEQVASGLEASAFAASGSEQRPGVRVHRSEASAWLKAGPSAHGLEPFDLIYLDPPWPAGLHAPLSQAVAAGGWLRGDGLLLWECPSEEAPMIPEGWRAREPRRYGGTTLVLLEPADQAPG